MQRVLMFDSIPMNGGSKVANSEILALCENKNITGYIASTHVQHWEAHLKVNSNIKLLPLKISPIQKSYGLGYWLMCCFYTLQLLLIAIREPKFHSYMGLSCPSNDMPLYLLRFIISKPIVQMIHGPVAAARSTGYCLTKAAKIYYLASTKSSILFALEKYLKTSAMETRKVWMSFNAEIFINGLSEQRWSSPANPLSQRVFWAASLLKWKNVDLLVEASRLDKGNYIDTLICYIEPQSELDTSTPDFEASNIQWVNSPSNLDELRASCGIFVSTSINEPFGLSILEALAAGMCVVIPSDDSYWDRVLIHGKNCIKYTPNCPKSLHNAIRLLNESPWQKVTMSMEALNLAQLYKANRCYESILRTLSNGSDDLTSKPKHKRPAKGAHHV
ncbi:glycosyltransferase family 4 protein [Vibrio rotiferianus]|uniref:glycosyltransferase family 4 protein n=1 Tax=Vibrio rotiferianus TaxID=190895 RepID=UPI0028949099|nr:Glycosyltransferase SypJ [Vibrio rotiferianus]